MHSVHSYFKLIQQIAEREQQRQSMLKPISSIIEIQNQILHTFSRPNFNYVNIANEVFNNSPAAIIERTINNVTRQTPSFITQPINIENDLCIQIQTHFYAIQNITDIYNVVSQILSATDISIFNNQTQYFYDNIPENIDTDVDEEIIKIAEVVYNAVEEFNKNATEEEKIPFCETPFAKNLNYALAILANISVILSFIGIDIEKIFELLSNILSK